MIRHTPQQQFKEAKQIAKDHGCFVIERGGKYQVFRNTGSKPAYLGARSTPESLRAFVCKVTNFH